MEEIATDEWKALDKSKSSCSSIAIKIWNFLCDKLAGFCLIDVVFSVKST